MKCHLGFILCVLLSAFCYGQTGKSYPFPDFMRIPKENRTDSINQWYVATLNQGNDNLETKEEIMKQARFLAAETGDPIMITFMDYLSGHLYREGFRDSLAAAPYISSAMAMAKQHHLDYMQALFMHDIGMSYLNLQHNHPKALEHLVLADEMLNELNANETHTLSAAGMKANLVQTYYNVGNYAGVFDVLGPLFPYMEKTPPDAYIFFQLYNTAGLCYREMNMPDSALMYFRKVIDKARQTSYNAWIGIAAGNIGSIYFKKHFYDSSEYYFELSNALVRNDPEVSGMAKAEAIMDLAEVTFLLNKNGKELLNALVEAEQLMNIRQLYPAFNIQKTRYRLYSLRLNAYVQAGNYEATNNLSKILRQLKDSIDHIENTALFTRVEVQLKADRSISRIKELETETALSLKRRNYLVALLALLGLLLFSLYKGKQLRNKQNRQLYESREQLLYAEQQRTEEQLNGYMEKLLEKNKHIEELQEEIERQKKLPYSKGKMQSIEAFEKLKQTALITEEDWLHFRLLFEKVHKGFLVRLTEKYPDITPAETRLMALAKLSIPRAQMAGMLGISKDSVRMTGYRFMRKINADDDTSLSEIVESI